MRNPTSLNPLPALPRKKNFLSVRIPSASYPMKITKPHLFFLLLLSVLSALLIGCASIVRGGSEKLVIQSNPSGAQVRLSTGQSATTPFEFEVKRKVTIFVSISKDGFHPNGESLVIAKMRANT